MDQTRAEPGGIEFTVTDRSSGQPLEFTLVTQDPDEAVRFLNGDPERYQAVVWRFGLLHGWRTPPDGGARIPAILRCPEFSRIQARAYQRIEAHLLATAREPVYAALGMMRYYGYFPDVAEGFRRLFQLEIASPLDDIVRFVDFAALARELVTRRVVEPMQLDDPELPPGIFLFGAPREIELEGGL